MKSNPQFYGLMVAASLVTFPAAALAQSEAGENVTEDTTIVVTARRKVEALTDVPVAVTVLSGEQLQRQNIQSLSELQRNVPTLNITNANGRGTAVAVAMRGMRQSSIEITVDPSVAVYINEVPVARPGGLDATAFDLESFQALKGPQGTLFGRNSTGGALLITTRKPGDSFGGYVRSYIEDPIGTGIEGAVDVPLADWAAVRIAGNYQWRRGYSRVVNTGQRLDDRNRWTGRVTLDLKPTDSIRSTFVAEQFRARENGVAIYAFNYTPGRASASSTTSVINSGYPAVYAAAQRLGWYETTASHLQSSRSDTFSVSNVTTFELSDDITLKSVAGYRYFNAHDITDADGSSANVISTDAAAGGRQYSEELQLQGNSLDEKLDWIVGGFWFRETGYDTAYSYTLRPPLVGANTVNQFTGENLSLSGFAHANYTLPFALRTRIYGGLRYTRDIRKVNWQARSIAANGAITCSVVVPGSPNSCSVPGRVQFSKLTWEAGFDVQPAPNNLIYFTVSTGYRSGGFNGRAQSVLQQTPFRPENATNYEIGAKTDFNLGDGRASINVALFQTEYQDIQRTVILNIAPPGQTPITGTNSVNAARATIKGAELEFVLRPTDRFTVNARYSYVQPKYKAFTTFDTVLGRNIDISNNRFYGIAPNQFGAGVSWVAVDSDSGRLTLASDVSYSDGFELNDLNVPGGRAPTSTVINASATWDKIAGSRVSATLYAKNLNKARYLIGGLLLNSSLDVSSAYHGAPRQIGLAVKLPFGAE